MGHNVLLMLNIFNGYTFALKVGNIARMVHASSEVDCIEAVSTLPPNVLLEGVENRSFNLAIRKIET